MHAGYDPPGAAQPPHDLPDALALPLASGAPHWYWLGGRPALDFVNTRRERWRRDVETLVTPRDLVTWLRAAGLLTAPDVCAGARELAAAIALREAIDAAVAAAVAGAPIPPAALAAIDGWLHETAPRPHLAIGPDGAPQLAERAGEDPLRAAIGVVALDAARALGEPAERARLRICAGVRCSARFYDRSRPATRRWCSMRTCGNAAKARRHRVRASTSVPSPLPEVRT
ncbi:MAG: CGNR zinc finger domain-containing protein [Actinobacteria bacterium]|nr:CGNR zinc finger domain-containing protein [Actinomycetota bacterium]